MPKTYAKRGLSISSSLRLSPTHSNVGLVGPYVDAGNHAFCKVEKTPAHPSGYLAIGRRIRGREPAIMVEEDGIGLTGALRYTLTMVREGADLRCRISRGGSTFATLDYSMRTADRNAYGTGRKVGIRMRLVARGTRRDEDDGRSRFEGFTAKTLS